MGAVDRKQLEELLAVQRRGGARLGEIMVGRGLVSPLALLTALHKQRQLPAPAGRRATDGRPATWTPLGRVLVGRGLISSVQLQQALADQREDGGFLGELLLERGWITAAELVDALSDQIQSSVAATEVFVVQEQRDGAWTPVHTAQTFMAATDFVFEHVLSQREPDRVEILRRLGDRDEVAWSYEAAPPVESNPKLRELVQAFQAALLQVSAP